MVRRTAWLLAFTWLAVAGLSACIAPPTTSLFPSSVKVHVYGAPRTAAIRVDKAGHVSVSGLTACATTDLSSCPPLAANAFTDGGWLSGQEMASLRTSVRFGKPPDDIAACFVPRHAFLFYDASDRYLGFLTVCFECGGAEVNPFKAAGPDRSWVYWNYDAVKRIVLTHHLGPLVEG